MTIASVLTSTALTSTTLSHGALLTDTTFSDLFDFGISPTEKVIRTVLVYLGILLIIRVSGKRLLAQMNSFDLVVVLLLSNVVQNAIIGNDNSLSGGLLGALVLVAGNAGLDRLSHRWPRLNRLLQGKATDVVIDGRVDERALRDLGMTRGELRTALRHQGADALSEVRLASLEPGGSVAVDLRPQDQNASRGDLDDAVRDLRAYLDERLAQPRREA
ncbi:uncharacterized membrane protein YcaP (DUF421 family) [Kineosphaera limosa]|uniref:YetF C-terminal domain-containing protein n=1 Tax=Kineosphaera limosa NBRC 100340 TaxID=1184609 RepID=K6WCL6_9MICO|nr:YetF domain-containing protein [Kineosphaera limosa]NYE00377.1 uncharacterized membrane protein YcaP (DUF421 family) [Kineosphaera limosa]GAB97015.1 hypothetical protein KILIM_054_00250 [Kineosphaera limosa NBRC 100340]